MTQYAFTKGLPGALGSWGSQTIAVCLSMFALSTLLGWCYYGERSVEYLFGQRSTRAYRFLFVTAAFLGAVYELKLVWNVADVLNGLMALPNLIGLVLLSGVVYRETRKYLQRDRTPPTPEG